jgi:hypothetical protein
MPSLPADYEALTGHTDASLRARTGKDWSEWTALLDAAGAAALSHAEIALLVGEHCNSAWWAQTTAVGYERIRGLRSVGQQRDRTHNASKSKSIRAAREHVFTTLLQVARTWDDAELGSTTPPKSVRILEPDGTKANLWLTDHGPDRCTVQVDHKGHATKDLAEAAKARWAARLAEVQAAATAS